MKQEEGVKTTPRENELLRDLRLWYASTKKEGEPFEIRTQAQGESSALSRRCTTPEDAEAFINSLEDFDKRHFWATLNPIDSQAPQSKAVGAKNVTRRRVLLVDCDPIRKDPTTGERLLTPQGKTAKVSSTEKELQAAKDKADSVEEYLLLAGFEDPVVLLSGNGVHLYYCVDLPNTPESNELVKGFLRALDFRFSDKNVEIDTCVYNADRITKLPGTLAVKGPDTPERPHRLCSFKRVPKDFQKKPNSPDLLRSIIKESSVELEAPRETRKQEDPTSKPGLVGAFCKCYSIEEAIATFLPDVYEPTGNPSRYTYKQGSTYGGLCVYDGLFAYSHHSTDPASSQLCNAFDLVRIHLFGELDRDADQNAAGVSLPSFAAMLQHVKEDANVAAIMGKEDFVVEAPQSEARKPEPRVPDFPFDVFPPSAQLFIEDAKEILNFPKEYTAAAMLAVTSGAIGNAYHVKRKDGHVEPPILYVVIVGGKGTCKSHPLSLVATPLEAREKELFQSWAKEREAWTIHEATRRKTEAPLPKPTRKHVLLKNSTAEARIQALAENPRGILEITDEFAGRIKSAGQYKGGRGDDLELDLTIFNGKPVEQVRKSVEGARVERPFLSQIGTIQPVVLATETRDKEANGYVDRLLLVWPQDVKLEHYKDDDKGLPPEDLTRWNNAIDSVLDISYNGTPREVKLSPEARHLFNDWYNRGVDESNRRNAQKLRKTDDDVFAGIHAKMSSYCLRLALVLEVLRQAYGETLLDLPDVSRVTEITAECMEGSVKLCEYFTAQAMEVRRINHATALESLKPDKRQLFDALPEEEFSVKDAKAILKAGTFIASERTLERFLADRSFFRRTGQGKYNKVTFN